MFIFLIYFQFPSQAVVVKQEQADEPQLPAVGPNIPQLPAFAVKLETEPDELDEPPPPKKSALRTFLVMSL